MIIMLQAKLRERLVCESRCSNTLLYSLACMPRNLFHVGNVRSPLLPWQCIITPGFSLVSRIWAWNRKSNRNLPLLQHRLHTAHYTSSSSSEMFLVFIHASPHLQPLAHPRDIRTQVHRQLVQLLPLEHPQNANCKHDADTSSWFISFGLRTPSL